MATFSYVDLDLPFMVEAIEAETRLVEQRRQPRRKRSRG